MADDAPLDKRRKLGRELKILRQRAGLTGPELAKLIGTTQTRVSRIENAVVKPKRSPTCRRGPLSLPLQVTSAMLF